jgi:hypothetical protein
LFLIVCKIWRAATHDHPFILFKRRCWILIRVLSSLGLVKINVRTTLNMLLCVPYLYKGVSKSFVMFAVYAMVVYSTLFALFKTIATCCMQFMSLDFTKLFLVNEPQAILLMVMVATTKRVIFIFTCTHYAYCCIKCALNSLSSQ